MIVLNKNSYFVWKRPDIGTDLKGNAFCITLRILEIYQFNLITHFNATKHDTMLYNVKIIQYIVLFWLLVSIQFVLVFLFLLTFPFYAYSMHSVLSPSTLYYHSFLFVEKTTIYSTNAFLPHFNWHAVIIAFLLSKKLLKKAKFFCCSKIKCKVK